MIKGNMVALFALRNNGSHLGRISVVVVFLLSFLVSGAWGACSTIGSPYYYWVTVNTSARCYSEGSSSCNPKCSQSLCSSLSSVLDTVIRSGSSYYTNFVIWSNNNYYCSFTETSGGGCGDVRINGVVFRASTECSTQSEADSVNCVNEGKVWQNGQCQNPLDSSACEPYRQECESYGGRFTGNVVSTAVSETGCLSFCDLCTSEGQELYRKSRALVCCRKGMSPPASVTSCQNLESSGSPDMSFSSFDCDNRGGYDCECEEISSENASTYNSICNNHEWPESSESGPVPSESSSSEEGSPSDTSGDWEYDYRDSLHRIIKYDSINMENTSAILSCLLSPVSCDGLSVQFPDSIKTPVFAFDTAFRKYLKPLMDSTLKVDSLQLKALLKLDTNQLKLLKADSASLKNDTVTWTKFDALGNVIDTSVHSQNDTTRKWFKRIADSIGVSTDSLAAHIDSIVRHIPDSVLDSIVKYQQYATDNFDSVLFGHGKGFSLVDSLIDSSVKYFKESSQKWNEYITMYGDSTQKIHEEILDLPGGIASAIGYALGYGDTATSTLRGDLNGIREAIEGLGDTSGLGGHGGGYADSLGRYRDSINKYYISDERFDELVDSTEAAWGVDSLDARWDSSYAYGLCEGDNCPPCSDDSCMGSLSANFVQRADSIARIAGDSLEASTKRQRDSLPTFWDSTFKELKNYSWFGSFDSTFLANIGAKIPNSNTCPEHCFVQDVNGTYAYVGYNMHLDWKLCRPIAPNVLNTLNAFDILKLLARILTVVTCLSILMWEVSSRRGGGIGL